MGHYFPPTVLDNSYFEGRLETSSEWIENRTGIKQRRVLLEGGTSDLVAPAVEMCLARRGISALEIDCIIVATITPDRLVPNTASAVQHKVGAKNAWGFDLSAACSGFVYALIVATQLVSTGAAGKVLVCGADKMTSLTNPDDRSTAVLFGDAAGVALVERNGDPEVGILDFATKVEGEGGEHLNIISGGSLSPSSESSVKNGEHYLWQNGQVVFKKAVQSIADISLSLLEKNGLSTEDLDWFVPHQANKRIIEAVAGRVGVPMEKVMLNVTDFGNTSAATIPTCMSQYFESGRLKKGDRILMSSFGAGWTSGSVYLKWAV